MNEAMKDVTWIGDSREQVRHFPKAVRTTVGEALRFAQRGTKPPKAKPMCGIGSGVWEIDLIKQRLKIAQQQETKQ